MASAAGQRDAGGIEVGEQVAELVDAVQDVVGGEGRLGRRGFTASENRVWRICSMQQIFSLHAKKKGRSRKPAVAAVVGAVACVVATDGLCLGAIAAGATEGSLFGGAGAAAGAAAAAVTEGAGALAAAGGATAGAGVAGEMLGDGAGEATGGEAGAEATAGESAGEAGAAPTPADPPPPPAAAKSAPAAAAPAEEAPAASPAKASSGCNSFAGATAVLMADGSSKPIDQVHVGDTITNAEPDSHDAEQHVVTAVHVTTTDKSFDDLIFSTPDGPATVTSTAQHLFWDVWRASHFSDSGPNKVWSGLEDVQCRNGGGSFL
ncbi:hypothetical protein AB0878_48500, partial [Amycolatopsis sp. NPDC047767]